MEDKRIKRVKRSIIELSTLWGIVCVCFMFWIFEVNHFHLHPDIPVPSYSVGALCFIVFCNFPAIVVTSLAKAILSPIAALLNPYITLVIAYVIVAAAQACFYYWLGKFIAFIFCKMVSENSPETKDN
jgi:hypothetical protein